jgi:lipopolysaccharide export LptBFGC system permease protein LptF
MRKIFMALAAVAALGLAVPLSAPAEAQDRTVIIKKRGDGPSYHSRRKVTIIKQDRRPRYYGENRRSRVVIKEGRRHNNVVIVKKKQRYAPASVGVRFN